MWPIRRRRTLREGRAAAAAGFTLVELLVVLVITALVSAVLLSGFERVLDIRLRLAGFLDGVEAPILVADWFRASVGGLVPDGKTGRDRFSGSARRLTGLSLAPLNATAGVPASITWEIAFDADTGRSYLRYRNGAEAEMTLASWPGDYGGLSYCGSDLSCHTAWPLDQRSTELPALVRLDALKGSEAWPILAAPQSARDPPAGQP